MNQRNQPQDIERRSKPQTEMGELREAVFGRNEEHDSSPINTVVAGGNLDEKHFEMMLTYHDLYSDIEFLSQTFDLPETRTESQLLEKIAAVAHFTKGLGGFAPEVLITRKQQQFQATKREESLDAGGEGLMQRLKEELGSRGDRSGSELSAPDPSW